MCLRYTLKALAPAAFNEALAEAAEAYEWQARYNVALTNRMPVITWRTKPTLETMQFGLALPARAPGGRPMLAGNARAETMLAKPGFRDAARHRRCLIPADGFYEWEKAGTTRRPHYFSLRSGAPFFFAGLWEPARDDLPVAFCIVTTTPNTLLQPIHHRMPVMLGPNSGPAWLGDEPLNPVQLTRLSRPLPARLMTGYRVDPRVNSVRYEAPDCVAAV